LPVPPFCEVTEIVFIMIGEPVCKFLSKLVHTITKRYANFTTTDFLHDVGISTVTN
jgi:hypothetical protein